MALQIELSHALKDKIRAAQAPEGHVKLFAQSETKLENLMRERIKALHPGASIITPRWYTKSDEWLAVSLTFTAYSEKAGYALGHNVNIAWMINEIRAVCEEALEDTANWLVTEPIEYAICGICGICGDRIQPNAPRAVMNFFVSRDSQGNSDSIGVEVHSECRGKILEQSMKLVTPPSDNE